MGPRSILITGCNRGIGLELVKTFLNQPSHKRPALLIGTCRDVTKADELQKIKSKFNTENCRFCLLQANFSPTSDNQNHDYSHVASQVETILKENGIDGLHLLINNAACLPRTSPQVFNFDDVKSDSATLMTDMRTAFEVNTLAPLGLTLALKPLLIQGAQTLSAENETSGAWVIMMSSAVGSIAENGSGSNWSYRTSKVALNMMMKNLSVCLAKDNIHALSMHPGWVRTEMGGPNALIETDECASTMVDTLLNKVIVEPKKYDGTFLRYNDTPIQW